MEVTNMIDAQTDTYNTLRSISSQERDGSSRGALLQKLATVEEEIQDQSRAQIKGEIASLELSGKGA